jgi:hypothetical protein
MPEDLYPKSLLFKFDFNRKFITYKKFGYNMKPNFETSKVAAVIKTENMPFITQSQQPHFHYTTIGKL